MKLTFEERRVIGTLVEKAHTTPEQCPLTLNSLVNGCNQKSCREPMSYFTEEVALDTLESLRQKGLAVLVRSSASRVDRWKQNFAATLHLSPKETAVLAELLLRGAQTDGELRQRASRMVRFESLDEVREALQSLQNREEPLVARVTPPGKQRGVKYDHRLYPDGEQPEAPPVDEEDDAEEEAHHPVTAARAPTASPSLTSAASSELSELREEVAELREQLSRLAERVGYLEARDGD
jgi:uncharacterized protein YceH (UPF0502 family)